MPWAIRMILAVYFFIAFWVHTVLCFSYVCGVRFLSLVRPRRPATFAEHDVCNFWGRGFFSFVPGWSYEIRGKEHLPTIGKPAVIIANHQSAADIFALFTLGIQFRWLSKREVFYIPLVGQAMSWAGYVSVTRGDVASQRRAIEESGRWLRRGVSMLYFPEGTRSLDGKLLEFKSGAFRLAELENVPIVPMVLRGTKELLVKASIVPDVAKVEIQVLPPTRRQADESMEQFIARVRQDITNELERV